MVQYGSRGNEVRELQTKLNQLGYNAGTVDGIFGTNTQSALKSYQKAQGLVVDGKADNNTWARLRGGSSGGGGTAGTTSAPQSPAYMEEPKIDSEKLEAQARREAGIYYDSLAKTTTQAAEKSLTEAAELTEKRAKELSRQMTGRGQARSTFAVKSLDKVATEGEEQAADIREKRDTDLAGIATAKSQTILARAAELEQALRDRVAEYRQYNNNLWLNLQQLEAARASLSGSGGYGNEPPGTIPNQEEEEEEKKTDAKPTSRDVYSNYGQWARKNAPIPFRR